MPGRIRTFGDVMAEFDHVDDPDVLERMETTPALRAALEMLRPENRWGTGLDPKVLLAIARDDAIPVVWVPLSTVLSDLAAASDHEARMSMLHLRRQEIVDHCKAIICLCDDPWLTDEHMLAQKAMAAYEDGHREAAMALAVCIGEPLAIWASTPRCQLFHSEADREEWERKRKKVGKYEWAALEVSATGIDPSRYEVIRQALIAPIPSFFTEWRPDKGLKFPDHLSRHVVVHQPALLHFSPENALLSLMLVASFLYSMQR
jgi:hypothetical protein